MRTCIFFVVLTAASEVKVDRRSGGGAILLADRPSNHDQIFHGGRIFPEAAVLGAGSGPRSSAISHQSQEDGGLTRSRLGIDRTLLYQMTNKERDVWDGWSENVAVQWIRGGCSSLKKPPNGMSRSHEEAIEKRVFLYYPNLIGYVRVALVLTSYYLAETRWRTSSCMYLVAFAGDAVDGFVARKFGQASRLGSVLDMVTDRCSTTGLLLVLSRLYSRAHAFAFLLLVYIDLFSHWMHMHSVLGQPHKSTSTLRRRNVLIRAYYENLALFGYCCVGAELFYVLLYLLHFWPRESRYFDPLYRTCYWLCLPACGLKQVVNVAQMFAAAKALASEELER